MEGKQKNYFSMVEVFEVVSDIIDEQLKRINKQAEQVQNIVCDFIPNGNEDEQREHEQQKDDFYYWFDRAETHGHENREVFLVQKIIRIVRDEFDIKTIFDKTKEKLIDIITSREDC